MRENTGRISEMIPNPGRIMMYTSGCPKNQNRCCHNNGEPPCDGSKKCVPKWRSVSSMVTAAAIVGRAKMSRTLNVRIAHTNSGSRPQPMPGARMLAIVT